MERRRYAFAVLSQVNTVVALTEKVETLAEQFQKTGVKPLDALHLASATVAEADYFCTCDDAFLRRARTVAGLSIKVVSPLELVEELEK